MPMARGKKTIKAVGEQAGRCLVRSQERLHSFQEMGQQYISNFMIKGTNLDPTTECLTHECCHTVRSIARSYIVQHLKSEVEYQIGLNFPSEIKCFVISCPLCSRGEAKCRNIWVVKFANKQFIGNFARFTVQLQL